MIETITPTISRGNKVYDNEEISFALTKQFNVWWRRIVEHDGEYDFRPSKYQREFVVKRFRHYSDGHEGKKQNVNDIVAGVSKVKNLLKVALSWEEPEVGAGTREYTVPRGQQWRTVIAWSGLNVLSRFACHEEAAASINTLIRNCYLKPYKELKAPKTAKLKKWLEEGTPSEALSLIGVPSGPMRKSVKSWLLESKSITNWRGAMQLAGALCHCTTTGFLTANKVKEWGLRPAFETLTSEIGIVVAASIREWVDFDDE